MLRYKEHLQNGAMKDHMRIIHRNIQTRSGIVKMVSCIKKFDNVNNKKFIMKIKCPITLYWMKRFKKCINNSLQAQDFYA